MQILLIQESCRLAVEICDDLLNYEKFDDNDMPLVIKTAPAVLLFHEIVQPFNVQVLYCTANNYPPTSIALHCFDLFPWRFFSG